MTKRIQHIGAIVLATLFLVTSNGVNLRHYCCELCAEHGMRMFTHECCCAEVHQNHANHHHADGHCCTHHHDAAAEHHGQTTCSTQENGCYLQHFDISTLAFHHNNFNFENVTLVSQTCEFTTAVTFLSTFSHITSSHAPPISGRDILTHVSILTI